MAKATPQNQTHFKDWPNEAAAKIELECSGYFPEYAAGSLYRTGPGGYKVERSEPGDGMFAVSHWFDGFTTMHKFDLVAGEGGRCSRVEYASYCQVDEQIENARKTGKLEGISFGQKRDPCDTLYKKFKTVFSPARPRTPHSSNIGVVLRAPLPAEAKRTEDTSGNVSGRRLMTVTTDTADSKQFDADTLEPLGLSTQKRLHPLLKGELAASHAAEDQATGDIFNYNLEFGARPVYRIFRASPKTGQVEILAEISGSDIRGAYIHSLFLTENFVVLCIWPAYFRANGAAVLWERNLVGALAPFDPNSKAIWLVVDRRRGRGLVQRFESPPFFCFHTVNAWEERRADGGEHVDLVCELVEFENMDILHRFYYENMVSTGSGVKDYADRDPNSAGICRYRLAQVPLTASPTGKARSTKRVAERLWKIAADKAGDLPRINPKYALKPHRYVWSMLDRGKSSFMDGIGKTDTLDQTITVWECPKHTPGEPMFIPAPGAQDEDEGVVLCVVFNGESSSSYLLCLDARTMTEIGRADVGRPVGLGFHGMHVPSAVNS